MDRIDFQRWIWQYCYAEVLYRLESYNEAEKEIRVCMDEWQDKIPHAVNWDIKMFWLLRNILDAQKKSREAIAVCRQVVEILAQRDWASDDSQRSWKVCLAKELKRNGELPEAESILRGLLAQREKDLEILPTLCYVLRDQGRNTDGIELVQEYLKMNDDSPGRVSTEAVVKLKLLLAERLCVEDKLLEAEETLSQLDSLGIAGSIRLADCRFRIGSQKKLEAALETLAEIMNMFAEGIADLVVRPLVPGESVDSRTEAVLELLQDQSTEGPKYARATPSGGLPIWGAILLFSLCLVRLNRLEEAKLPSQTACQVFETLKAQFPEIQQFTLAWIYSWQSSYA
jgi:hypothetical protein